MSEANEKVTVKEIHHYHHNEPSTSKPKWDGGSFGGLLILGAALPLIGLIVGLVNLKHSERNSQAVFLTTASVICWALWYVIFTAVN